MALFPSMGARPNSDGSGTSAQAVRKGLERLFTGPGVLPGAASPLVTGASDWSYSVGAAGFVTQRAASDGVHLLGNDGPVSVATTAAPGTGSRIDVIWVRQRSNGENGDTTSLPDFGVTQGASSGSPVKPSIPTGALELATATVAAGSANTAAATITQTAAVARLVEADTGWANLTLWTGATTANSLTPQIRRLGSVVRLSGRVTQANVADSWIAEIPVGFRPRAREWRIPVMTGASGATSGVLVYDPSNFRIFTVAGVTVNLDGVTWIAEG